LYSAQRITAADARLRTAKPPTKGRTVPL
jgi:hypothetical protein